MTYTERPCAVDEHTFDRSRITNEPLGRCYTCGATVAWAEAQEEGDPEVGDEPGPLCKHGNGPECTDCTGAVAS